MKYKYLLFCILVSLLFLLVLSPGLDAQSINNNEQNCLDALINPSKADRVHCKARSRIFSTDVEHILHIPRTNIVSDSHTPEQPASAAIVHPPEEVYEDLLSRSPVYSGNFTGAGTITFKATGTDYERIEVWGPAGTNLTGSKILWCTIDMTPGNNRKNWYQAPYECIDIPYVADWNDGTTGPHYHVYVTRATVYMRRTPNILWRCTSWFFWCTGGEHYPDPWWGETVENPWALGKGNILKSGTTHHTWTF